MMYDNVSNSIKTGCSSFNHEQSIEYNKENITKILYSANNKHIKIFLSYVTKPNHDTTPHYPVTDELIKQVNLYLTNHEAVIDAQSVSRSQFYLVMNSNENRIVDFAYLGHLYDITQDQYWQFDIIPLINYTRIINEWSYIHKNVVTAAVSLPGPRMYNDINISEAHVSKVIEHIKLRLEYSDICRSNFHQYKQLLTDIYDQDPKYLEQKHQTVLTQSWHDSMDELQNVCGALSLYGENSNYEHLE